MARPRSYAPAYRQNSSGSACVTLTDPDGRRQEILLGVFGSKESRDKYEEVLSAWIGRGRTLPTEVEPQDISVNEIAFLYLEHCKRLWSNDKYQTHYTRLNKLIGLLCPLHGLERAEDFGPKKLKRLREQLIAQGLSRSYINRNISDIKRMFKFASEEELISGSVWHALMSVGNLTKGTPGIKADKEVQPVDPEVVEQTIPHLPPLLQVVVRLQRITGARGAELLAMKSIDIDRSNPQLWKYKPTSHKTQRYGHHRVIVLGPKCIELLTPWLDGVKPEEYLFSPKRSEAIRLAARAANRKTPRWASHQKRNASIKAKASKRKRKPGDRYCKKNYLNAIRRACQMVDRAIRAAKGDKRKNVKVAEQIFAMWHPHQLRHLVSKELKKKYGAERARAILGHRTVRLTEHYGGLDLSLAEGVAIEAC